MRFHTVILSFLIVSASVARPVQEHDEDDSWTPISEAEIPQLRDELVAALPEQQPGDIEAESTLGCIALGASLATCATQGTIAGAILCSSASAPLICSCYETVKKPDFIRRIVKKLC